ncbi:MAG: hypothetical protein EOM55_00025 [Clostridia bacterium]|nr:hypothetical protein [Clostridia bacterium]
MMKIGTSGFRGVIGEDFCKENVCKITQCLCDILKKKNFKREVVVGFDNRFLSEIFAKWICEVLCANGILAKLTKTSVPSPLVSFSNKLLNNDLSVMITASHNPYYYNGLKIFSKNGQDLESELEKMFEKNLPKVKKFKFLDYDECVKNGKVEIVSLVKEYVGNILKFVKIKKNIKAKTLFNVMNGSSFECVLELKKQLKLDCQVTNENRDVSFGFSAPIPNEENLEVFKKLALEKKADFAFATDGDGDRLAVFDEVGNYHNGNEICSLIYYYLVKERNEKGAFVKNFSFSILADKVCENLKTKIIETAIGFKHIAKAITENNGIIGAENSGCEVACHTSTKDGLVVFAMLLEIVEFYNKPLSKIIEDMKKEVGYNLVYKEISFKVKDRKKVEIFFENSNINFPKKVFRIDKLDGVKFIFDDDTWVLVRFSGTENLLRLVAEQKTKREVEKMLNYVLEMVEKLGDL